MTNYNDNLTPSLEWLKQGFYISKQHYSNLRGYSATFENSYLISEIKVGNFAYFLVLWIINFG